MGKLDKLRDAFLQSRKTFAWSELVSLLNLLGYEKKEMQGSRVRFYNQKIDIQKDTLDADHSMLIFSEFVSAEAAIKYMSQLKHDAPGEVSWLPASKYVFYIISNDNLELLKQNKRLDSYIELLKEKYPDKF